jgi:acyl dehydratase
MPETAMPEMTKDTSVVGRPVTGSSLLVTRSRLRFFAKATGQTDPVFTDVDAARAAGHRDLPVPLTFFMGIDLEASDPFGWMAELGIDLRTVLHGEQRFVYHRMAYAGDELSTTGEIVDVYEKKGGALQFFVRSSKVVTQDGELAVEALGTTVVRQLHLS